MPSTVRRPFVASGRVIDAAFVTYRLEEAGATRLALPETGYSARPKTFLAGNRVHCHCKVMAGPENRLRRAVPSPTKIARMDEALARIPPIPQDKHFLRRIGGARCLVSPLTGRHLSRGAVLPSPRGPTTRPYKTCARVASDA